MKNEFNREENNLDDFNDNDLEETQDEDIDYNEYYPDDEADAVGMTEEETIIFAQNERERKKELKKKKKKLTGGQRIAISIVCILYVLILLAAAVLIFHKPSSKNPNEIPFDITDDSTDDSHSDTPNGSKPNKNNTDYVEVGEAYNILLVGHDKLAHLADVTMIVNCNTKTNTVSVIQIPRDTYVNEGSQTGRINAVYAGLYNSARIAGSEDPYGESLQKYAEFLEKNLCINIHQTAIIDLDGFKNIVNAVGGVDVYVPNDMYYSDPAQDLYISIPAGMQHMDGEMAEGFVRFRSGYVQADIGRVNAQKIFLTAFFNKVKSTVKSVDVSTLSTLMDEVKKNVHTDMSVLDILFYAKQTLKINLEDIRMMTAPGSVAGNYYVINRQATLDAINTYFNVYNKDISDNIFDRNKVFCDTDAAYISRVYYDDPANVLDGEYTADSIDDESIYIPRTQSWVNNSTSSNNSQVVADNSTQQDNTNNSGDYDDYNEPSSDDDYSEDEEDGDGLSDEFPGNGDDSGVNTDLNDTDDTLPDQTEDNDAENIEPNDAADDEMQWNTESDPDTEL